MRTCIALLLTTGALLLLTGCPYFEGREDCTFTGQVQNMASINSIYDDYNSAAPFIESQIVLKFSTNRNSNGQDFDIIFKNITIFCDFDDGKVTISNHSNLDTEFEYLHTLFSMINTTGNELGPLSVVYHYWEEKEVYRNHVVFSTDTSGNHDLCLAWYALERDAYYDTIYEECDLIRINSLNTDANECYVGFYGDNFITYSDWYNYPEKIQEVYFCSDRDGNYDIFQTTVPEGYDEIRFFSADTTWPVEKNTLLSSEADDKCPFISGKVLVFASDRPGGYGGFDLYYSRRAGATWTAPQNFGDRINTAFNEYRPVIIMISGFTNELMFFSSDRPGGSGGYDLYYTGIPPMTTEVFED
ncbi:MAG TPA: hypothetical protein PKH94_03510 [Bacteroidales bacterium]|nr:hypothetical protein [Bacteroidales bacterium]HNS46281.1 hypothetical protein [Bacteroidales bacterium]